MTYDGQPYHRAKYKEIVTEQVILGYLTKGGVTYRDSETMTPYERKIAIEAINNLYKEQNEKQEAAVKQAKIARQNQSPKSLMHK